MGARSQSTKKQLKPADRHRAFLLERFFDFLTLEKGSSGRTQDAYARDVTRFVDFALVKGAAAPLDVTPRLLREFVYQLKDLGLSPASIRRNVSAVRSYFGFLIGDGHVVRDPSERLETPQRWRTLPEVLTVAETRARKARGVRSVTEAKNREKYSPEQTPFAAIASATP